MNENVYQIDNYRRDPKALKAAMRRHPCNQKPPLRLTQRGRDVIVIAVILLFVSAMGFVGYVEGL